MARSPLFLVFTSFLAGTALVFVPLCMELRVSTEADRVLMPLNARSAALPHQKTVPHWSPLLCSSSDCGCEASASACSLLPGSQPSPIALRYGILAESPCTNNHTSGTRVNNFEDLVRSSAHYTVWDLGQSPLGFPSFPLGVNKLTSVVLVGGCDSCPLRFVSKKPCRNTTSVKRGIFTLFQQGGYNFNHWMTDSFSTVYWEYRLQEALGVVVPIVFPKPLLQPKDSVYNWEYTDLPEYVYESLELFRVSRQDVLFVSGLGGPLPEDVYFDELYVPRAVSSSMSPQNEEAMIANDILRHRLMVDMRADVTRERKSKGRRVYLARDGSSEDTGQNRSATNEDEMIRFLKEEHSFDWVKVGKMSFWERAKYFADVSLVVSQSGANLVNLLFMPRGTVFANICGRICMPWYDDWLTERYGIRGTRLDLALTPLPPCDPDKLTGQLNCPFEFDMSKVKKELGAFLMEHH